MENSCKRATHTPPLHKMKIEFTQASRRPRPAQPASPTVQPRPAARYSSERHFAFNTPLASLYAAAGHPPTLSISPKST